MPNCSDCESWAAHETGGTGLCRARAPLPGNPPTGDYGAIWPKTKATDYCGEFSAKGGKPVEGPEAVDPATSQHQQGQAQVAYPVSEPAQRIARSTNKPKRRSTR